MVFRGGWGLVLPLLGSALLQLQLTEPRTLQSGICGFHAPWKELTRRGVDGGNSMVPLRLVLDADLGSDFYARISSPEGVGWAQLLISSYERIVGKVLIPRLGDAREEARALFRAPRAVVSHGTEEDPILNYGNQIALELWNMTYGEFTRTPSRLTAEPMVQEEREALLKGVKEKGFINNYSGVRISSSGRRFLIKNATVWEIYDTKGIRHGQAATFTSVTYLGEDVLA